MKGKLNIYLVLFHGYTPSWAFSFIVFFFHNIIIYYPNDKMDTIGSPRIESFIFLIAWGIFFESWELDLQFLPYFLLLLWVEIFLVCTLPRVYWKYSLPSGTHSSNEWIPWSWEGIQGGYHNFCILYFFIHCFKLFFDLRDPCKVWLYGLCILDLYILQLISQSHLLIYILPFK